MEILKRLGLLTLLNAVLYLAEGVGEMCQAPTPITINTSGGCGGSDNTLENRVRELERVVLKQQGLIMELISSSDKDIMVIRDCADVFKMGNTSDGVYEIKPEGMRKTFKVYCKFDDSGHWTVIQRRIDGTTDFQRSWIEYKKGFGSLAFNHWLGNDYIYVISNQRQYRLRIDITDWDGYQHYAEYKLFRLDGEDNKYAIHYSNYSGTAGDSMGDYHNAMRFSTFDQDNDINMDDHCALIHGGGWWYRECDHGNLNGYYNYNPNLRGPSDGGIEWDSWKELYSFKETMMRIKPAFPN